jgi:hypothetical protein
MKQSTIKGTYSLDPLTATEIEALAKAWNVPKSEVIRRSVHAAASQSDLAGPRPPSKLAALEALQAEPRLSPAEVENWEKEIRAERRAR